MKKMLKISSLAAISIATLSASIAPLAMAWGDNTGGRATYSINQINNGAIDDKITFNSIVDTNENLSEKNKAAGVIVPLSDERNFVGARVDNGNNGKHNVWDGNEINVEEGKTYLIRLYVHNNNRKGHAMIAKDVTANIKLPVVISKSAEVNGFINSSNATPSRYWDNVMFKSDRAFYLDYIEGSALFENNAIGKNGGVKLSDDVVRNGVTLGYDALNGNMPGCYEYSGVVTIKVKPVFEDSSIQKKVRLESGKTFEKSVDAKIGDTVEFQVHYKNLNDSRVESVIIRDSLPKGMQYIPGTTKLYTTNHPKGATTDDNSVVIDGINIGNFAVNGDGYVRFKAKVVDDGLACGNNRIINWAKSTANGFALQDSADVYVNKHCDTPTPNPNPNPNPTPKPTPETPNRLPSTGPAGIITGVIGVGGIVTALGYYIASRKQLR